MAQQVDPEGTRTLGKEIVYTDVFFNTVLVLVKLS